MHLFIQIYSKLRVKELKTVIFSFSTKRNNYFNLIEEYSALCDTSYTCISVFCSQNVLHLQKRLPNVILLEENDNKLWSHTDFIWALNAKSLIYDRLLEVMRKFKT